MLLYYGVILVAILALFFQANVTSTFGKYSKIRSSRGYTSLLNDKVGKKILVSLYDPQTKEHWDEVVRPYGIYCNG